MNLSNLRMRLTREYPVTRKSAEPHPLIAAVLIILYPKHNKTHVLMIKRGLDLKVHPGEIAFPGGVYKEEDEHLLGTALRETHEELGLELEENKVVACLPTVQTRIGFEITPFAAILPNVPLYNDESDEVDEVLEIPLTSLLSTQQKDVGYKPSEEMIVYWHRHHRIWGASAKILQRIEKLCGA